MMSARETRTTSPAEHLARLPPNYTTPRHATASAAGPNSNIEAPLPPPYSSVPRLSARSKQEAAAGYPSASQKRKSFLFITRASGNPDAPSPDRVSRRRSFVVALQRVFSKASKEKKTSPVERDANVTGSDRAAIGTQAAQSDVKTPAWDVSHSSFPSASNGDRKINPLSEKEPLVPADSFAPPTTRPESNLRSSPSAASSSSWSSRSEGKRGPTRLSLPPPPTTRDITVSRFTHRRAQSAASATPTASIDRAPLHLTIHTGATIFERVEEIEDDESRRLSEAAFI